MSMYFKRIGTDLICSILPAFAYVISALATGIGGLFALLITSIVYGIIQYFCLRTIRKVDYVIRISLFILLALAFVYITLEYDVFYHMFQNTYSEKPSASNGFGVVASLGVNIIVFLFAVAISFAKNRIDKEK